MDKWVIDAINFIRTQVFLAMVHATGFPLLSSLLRLRANGRNNFQHCCANNVGSCCVRVGSGVQTDATTPNNVGICSASWEGYNP